MLVSTKEVITQLGRMKMANPVDSTNANKPTTLQCQLDQNHDVLKRMGQFKKQGPAEVSGLSLGSFVTLYDPINVKTKLDELEGQDTKGGQTRVLTKMLNLGGTRWISKPANSKELSSLYELCPNFQTVIDDIRKYVSLAAMGSKSLNFMPILLAGDPGVGKTHFGKVLAKHLQTDFSFIPMSSTTAGFVLSGSHPTWHGAKMGKIAEALINNHFANPLVMLDEIDKSAGDARHDSLGPLYQLLEQETAREFTDEYVDVPIDASCITWVCTANDLSRIPEPILSRMAVYEIPRPTQEQGMVIARNIYRTILQQNGWSFDEQISEDVLNTLSAVSPREMRKTLIDALGSASLDGRFHLQTKDIRQAKSEAKTKLGFY